MSDSDVEPMEIDEPSQVQPGTSTDNLPNVEDSSKMETEDDDGNESIQQAVEGTIDNMVDQVCEQMELEVIKETTINNLPDQILQKIFTFGSTKDEEGQETNNFDQVCVKWLNALSKIITYVQPNDKHINDNGYANIETFGNSPVYGCKFDNISNSKISTKAKKYGKLLREICILQTISRGNFRKIFRLATELDVLEFDQYSLYSVQEKDLKCLKQLQKLSTLIIDGESLTNFLLKRLDYEHNTLQICDVLDAFQSNNLCSLILQNLHIGNSNDEYEVVDSIWQCLKANQKSMKNLLVELIRHHKEVELTTKTFKITQLTHLKLETLFFGRKSKEMNLPFTQKVFKHFMESFIADDLEHVYLNFPSIPNPINRKNSLKFYCPINLVSADFNVIENYASINAQLFEDCHNLKVFSLKNLLKDNPPKSRFVNINYLPKSLVYIRIHGFTIPSKLVARLKFFPTLKYLQLKNIGHTLDDTGLKMSSFARFFDKQQISTIKLNYAVNIKSIDVYRTLKNKNNIKIKRKHDKEHPVLNMDVNQHIHLQLINGAYVMIEEKTESPTYSVQYLYEIEDAKTEESTKSEAQAEDVIQAAPGSEQQQQEPEHSSEQDHFQPMEVCDPQ